MALQSVRNQLDNPAEEPAAKKTKTNDMAAAPALASRKDFEALFPKLVEEVVEHVDGYNIPSDARDWLRTVCDSFSCVPPQFPVPPLSFQVL